MRKNKREKVLTLHGLERLWRVTLPDGRRAEVRARNKKKAAEQAGAIWDIPLEWMRARAKICPMD